MVAWFQQEAKPLSEAYEGALYLLERKKIPGRFQFIAHAIRDICDRLYIVLYPETETVKSNYPAIIDKIVPHWDSLNSLISLKSDTPESSKTILINRELASVIKDLVEHRKMIKKQPNNQEKLLQCLIQRNKSELTVNQRTVDRLRNLKKEFVSDAHFSHKMVSYDEETLQKKFREFEEILHSFAGNFFTNIPTIDTILRKRKIPEIDNIINLLSSPEHEEYFFTKLSNPSWLPILSQNGFFTHPPQQIEYSDGRVHHPRWPQSEFLQRVAHEKSDEVADILLKINTNNASIVKNIVECALSMPPNVAIKLAPVLKQAIQKKHLTFCVEETFCLISHLASTCELTQVEKLAQLTLKSYLPQTMDNPMEDNALSYVNGVRKIIEPLCSKTCYRKILQNLCWRLKDTIENSEGRFLSNEDDLSWLWYPAIEEDTESHRWLSCNLVQIVRDGFSVAMSQHPDKLPTILDIFESKDFNLLVFKRIKLHLIEKYVPTEATRIIFDRSLFDDPGVKHEYANLVQSHFDSLSDEKKEEWFNWVDEGPKSTSQQASPQISQKHEKALLAQWMLEKLYWVREHLKGKRNEKYQKLFDKFGHPLMADRNIITFSGAVGTQSPFPLVEMQKYSFEEVVIKICTWTPTQSAITTPSVTGLADTFGEFVSENRFSFSKNAKVLINQPAIFVRKYLEQMTCGIRSRMKIPLEDILTLCDWVIDQDASVRTTPAQKDEGLVDQNWQWTRDSISQLLKAICEAKTNDNTKPVYPAVDFKQSIWNLIKRLANDSACTFISPSTDNYSPYFHDFIEEGINSSEGKVFEAAFAYARWIAENNGLFDRDSSNISQDFEEMPEVKELIKTFLESGNLSPGTLAIIGFNTNLLYWIANSWLKQNTPNLFPLSRNCKKSNDPSHWACWNAFLVWTTPHIEYFKIFKQEFELAISHYAGKQLNNEQGYNPVIRMGEHLVILYLRGEVELEGIITKFFTASDLNSRVKSMKFAGYVLEKEQNLTSEVLTRARQIWSFYWENWGVSDANNTPHSWPFLSWVLCQKLPFGWILDQIEFFLESTPAGTLNQRILKAIVPYSEESIERILPILDKTLRNSNKWQLHSYVDDAFSLLQIAMTGPESIREQAKVIINYLGRLGFHKFLKLL